MKNRLWASLFYFVYFAAGGLLFPFLPLFYELNGQSKETIGILTALPTVMTIIAGPLWASIADHFHLHRRLLPLVMSGVILPVLLFPRAGTFALLAVLVLLYGLFNTPIIPLADNAVLEMLGEQRTQYGKLRIWGAIGFGLSAWIGGVLATRWSINAIFLCYPIMMGIGAFAATKLPAPTLVPADWSGLRNMLTDRRLVSFLLTLLLVGASYSILNNYFILYVRQLGGSAELFGLSVAVAGVSELPVFFFSAWFLRRYGAPTLLMIAFACFALRAFAYAAMPSSAWVIPVQLLHGLTFSAMWAASVPYLRQITPPGWGATAQSMLGAVLFGLSATIGSLLGGVLYNRIGPVAMFQVAGVLALAGLAVFVLTQRQERGMS